MLVEALLPSAKRRGPPEDVAALLEGGVTLEDVEEGLEDLVALASLGGTWAKAASAAVTRCGPDASTLAAIVEATADFLASPDRGAERLAETEFFAVADEFLSPIVESVLLCAWQKREAQRGGRKSGGASERQPERERRAVAEGGEGKQDRSLGDGDVDRRGLDDMNDDRGHLRGNDGDRKHDEAPGKDEEREARARPPRPGTVEWKVLARTTFLRTIGEVTLAACERDAHIGLLMESCYAASARRLIERCRETLGAQRIRPLEKEALRQCQEFGQESDSPSAILAMQLLSSAPPQPVVKE